jgi:hypothetical protein
MSPKTWKVGDRVFVGGVPAGRIALIENGWFYVNWDPPTPRGPFLTTKIRVGAREETTR